MDAATAEPDIPKRAVVVTTRHSVYRLGRANSKGERTVSRDTKSLAFTRCTLALLAVGERMELGCLDGPDPLWFTSPVESIERVKVMKRGAIAMLLGIVILIVTWFFIQTKGDPNTFTTFEKLMWVPFLAGAVIGLVGVKWTWWPKDS